MNTIQKLVDKIDKYQQNHRFPGFVYAVIKKFGEDDAGHQAALLTYYGFLSLFPLLMVVITVTGIILGNNPELEKTIIDGITDYFPLLGSDMASHIHALHRSGVALAIGILFTLYGTRGLADVFQAAIQKIWGFKRQAKPGFPYGMIRSVGIVVIGGLGFLLASISAGYAASAGSGWAFRTLSVAINLFILYWLFIFLLNASLPRHLPTKGTRLGAACAAAGLVTLQAVGGYILARELKNLDALYSYFALALGLLFWIYLQAQILYFAAEIAVVSSQKLWPRSFNEPKA